MVGYIVMVCTSIILIVLGYKIYKGNLSLLMEYHQHRVKEEDKKVYANRIGMLMITWGVYNIISYFLTELFLQKYTLTTIFFGVTLFLIGFIYVQRKYNGGVF